jgi:hypothetical protein
MISWSKHCYSFNEVGGMILPEYKNAYDAGADLVL